MTARDTRILIHRIENHHGHKIGHQPYECAASDREGSKINFHNDLVELTETVDRLQMAENILQKLVATKVIKHYSGRVFLDVAATLTPEEIEYLQGLA
jgi:hypothetical protein